MTQFLTAVQYTGAVFLLILLSFSGGQQSECNINFSSNPILLAESNNFGNSTLTSFFFFFFFSQACVQ
jgi:hypothetical protein